MDYSQNIEKAFQGKKNHKGPEAKKVWQKKNTKPQEENKKEEHKKEEPKKQYQAKKQHPTKKEDQKDQNQNKIFAKKWPMVRESNEDGFTGSPETWFND